VSRTPIEVFKVYDVQVSGTPGIGTPGRELENVHFRRYLIILQFGTPGRQKSGILETAIFEVFEVFPIYRYISVSKSTCSDY